MKELQTSQNCRQVRWPVSDNGQVIKNVELCEFKSHFFNTCSGCSQRAGLLKERRYNVFILTDVSKNNNLIELDQNIRILDTFFSRSTHQSHKVTH